MEGKQKMFYLVRHGESTGNITRFFYNHDESDLKLTEEGMNQASAVAKRFTKLPIDAIVSSNFVRARQTAEIIANELQYGAVIETPLFVESRPASITKGVHEEAPESIAYKREVFSRYGTDDAWRHSDEENPQDLIVRAREALQFLQGVKSSHVVVVTHGMFLRVLVGYVLFGERMTGYELKHLMLGLATKNTGVTVIRYNEEAHIPWKVITWNDHSHLPS